MIDAEMEDRLRVLDGVDLSHGTINTSDAVLAANIRHSIRLGYPQLRPQAVQPERVCLVGGGPSLSETLPELLDLYFAGAKVVTVNGAYHWCLARNIKPSAQIVLDARPDNARFVLPAVPGCKYLVASQCAPQTWAAVDGRPDVWIWHAAAQDNPILKPILDAYYAGHWMPSPGGTTVVMRALTILRATGFLRFDLFGVDSCVMGDTHHAYQQPENDGEQVVPVTVAPTGHQELARTFQCTAWHIKQLECFLQTVRLFGDAFVLNVHGDGMLAFALHSSADVQWSVKE